MTASTPHPESARQAGPFTGRFLTEAAPTWSRIVLLVLSIPQLVTGIWAVSAPQHWYDTFPGFGPLLIAAEPPFNHHLVNDAGAGFLATGIFLFVAAMWGLRPLVLVSAAALAVFAVPHFIYHALNPAELLSDSTNLRNSITLFFAAAAPVAVVIALVVSALRGRTRGETS